MAACTVLLVTLIGSSELYVPLPSERGGVGETKAELTYVVVHVAVSVRAQLLCFLRFTMSLTPES